MNERIYPKYVRSIGVTQDGGDIHTSRTFLFHLNAHHLEYCLLWKKPIWEFCSIFSTE